MSHNNPCLETFVDTPSSSSHSWKNVRKEKHLGLILRRRTEAEKLGLIKVLGFLVSFIFFLIYISFATNFRQYKHMIVKEPADDINLPGPKVPKGYLVWSPQCKIPDLNPLANDVMKLFTKEEFEVCSTKLPLTTIQQDFDKNIVKIVFHEKLLPKYTTSDQHFVECCYQEISRSGENSTADDKFNLSKCNYFESTFELPMPTEFILVQCKAMYSETNRKNSKTVYLNAHAVVRKGHETKKLFDNFKTLYPSSRPLSVLIIGIDSISRSNLIRAMPNTAQHLYDSGWFELKGYNKIDDNTYPNLMAILTGYNYTLSFSQCNPKKVGELEKCPFIWKYFEENGYVTGYAEDEAKINTFNYHKFGFINQPTTHYFRPFALAAEKYLKTKLKSTLKFCLGFQNYADFIYQYANDFATTYKNDPFFGLFWTNTFSHNDISDPSSMDLKVKSYLKELNDRGILNTSMIIFLSDHGLRFGPVRQLHTGWLEERLPFIFIWLPEWFKNLHPNIVQNLKVNRNRLTNPYDIHMTLKHILELSGRIDHLPTAISCSKCQSLFYEVPWNRSCEDSSIDAHWCTCIEKTEIEKSKPIVKEAVKFVLNYINQELDKNTRTNSSSKRLCAHLTLKNIILAKKSEIYLENTTNSFLDYLLIFEALPSNGKFESTVRYYISRKKFEISGSISRLNLYGTQSSCVSTDYLKKYCYCLKKKKRSGK